MTLQKQKNDLVFSAKSKPLVVVGIPAFNEERAIAKVVVEAQKVADVVLVCDDGSTDMTAEIAKRLGADVISHNQNLGYGAAIKTLFTSANDLHADVLVTLDADGQHNPHEIPKLIKPVLDDEADIVLGSRFLDENKKTNGVPRYRRLGIKIISKLTNVAANHDFKDTQCGFRVYGRKALVDLTLVENGMGSSIEILIKAKNQDLRMVEISTDCKYSGLQKTSTFNPFTHGTRVVTSIIQMIVEERPLSLLGLPGIIFLFTGLFFGVWMFKIFVEEQQIITNIALAAIAFSVIGLFSLFTSITLYALSRHSKKE